MKISLSHRNILSVLLALFLFYTQYFQYEFTAMPSMVTILGGIVLAFGYIGIIYGGNYKKCFKVKEFKIMSLFFLLSFFTGIVTSPNVIIHMKYWFASFEYFLLVPCFMYIFKSKKLFLRFCAFYLFIALLCAFSLWHHPVIYEKSVEGIRYSLSLSLNVNMLGLFLTLGCWCCCTLMSFFPKFTKYGLILVLFLLYANNLTGSRKNLIAIVLILSLWFFIYWLPENKNNYFKKFFIGIVIVFIVYYCYIHFYLGSSIANRMDELIVSSDGTENARIGMYRIAFNIFENNILFGLGFHGYGIYVGKINSYSHATYAEVLANTGLVGSLLFIGMYVYSFFKILMIINKIKKIKELKNSLLLMKLSLILWCSIIFMSVGIIYFYELVCFVIWGVLFSMIQIAENEINNYFKNQFNEI